MASVRRASQYAGLVAQPPPGSRVRAPALGGGSGPPEAESFVHFHTKEWPKVKDLNDSLPPYLDPPLCCVA